MVYDKIETIFYPLLWNISTCVEHKRASIARECKKYEDCQVSKHENNDNEGLSKGNIGSFGGSCTIITKKTYDDDNIEIIG